ncbi:hypothetical protein AAFF39_00610 [Lactococcus garvieae]
MNLAQIQSVQYLFNKVYRDSSKKLIVKFDDEHITADFFKRDKDNDPVLLDAEDENRIEIFRSQFKNLYRDFIQSLDAHQARTDFITDNPKLILIKMIELVKPKSYDIQENIIYNVEFLNTNKNIIFT